MIAAEMLTDGEYQAKRRAIALSADPEREQALLFAQSERTVEQIAHVEQRDRRWVADRLRFGRFLQQMSGAIPKNLTLRRFLEYWDKTDRNEPDEVRERAVLPLMLGELTLSKSTNHRRAIADVILEKFADGKWHPQDEIVAACGEPVPDVVTVLTQMRTRRTYKTHCERRKGGKNFDWLIRRGRREVVNVEVVNQALGPIVHALKIEGRKHVAEASPGTIAQLAHDLEIALEQIT